LQRQIIPTAPRRPVNIPIVVVCAAPEADPDDAGDDADADDDAEPVEFVQLTFDGTVAVLESVTSEALYPTYYDKLGA